MKLIISILLFFCSFSFSQKLSEDQCYKVYKRGYLLKKCLSKLDKRIKSSRRVRRVPSIKPIRAVSGSLISLSSQKKKNRKVSLRLKSKFKRNKKVMMKLDRRFRSVESFLRVCTKKGYMKRSLKQSCKTGKSILR